MLFRKKIDRYGTDCQFAGKIDDETMVCQFCGIVPSDHRCRRFRRIAGSGGSGGAGASQVRREPVYYTVRKGDSLWAIAKGRGMALSDLIALNPQIRNPNRIYPGEKVRVR